VRNHEFHFFTLAAQFRRTVIGQRLWRCLTAGKSPHSVLIFTYSGFECHEVSLDVSQLIPSRYLSHVSRYKPQPSASM
jgi:hypothetical protein